MVDGACLDDIGPAREADFEGVDGDGNEKRWISARGRREGVGHSGGKASPHANALETRTQIIALLCNTSCKLLQYTQY